MASITNEQHKFLDNFFNMVENYRKKCFDLDFDIRKFLWDNEDDIIELLQQNSQNKFYYFRIVDKTELIVTHRVDLEVYVNPNNGLVVSSDFLSKCSITFWHKPMGKLRLAVSGTGITYNDFRAYAEEKNLNCNDNSHFMVRYENNVINEPGFLERIDELLTNNLSFTIIDFKGDQSSAEWKLKNPFYQE